MIKRPTVFVLGAGASAPYGFPLGGSLIGSIRGQLLREPQGSFAADLQACGFTSHHLNDFATALEGSGRYSIDEFLQWRSEYRELGKLAIARALIPCEQPARLNPHADCFDPLNPTTEDLRWYRYFFDQLLTSRKGRCLYTENNVAFITFNFDRSFEYALLNFLLANCAAGPLEASGQLRATPSHHVHGQLGFLGWTAQQDGEPRREFNDHDTTPRVLLACAKHIRVVDEELVNSPVLAAAHDA